LLRFAFLFLYAAFKHFACGDTQAPGVSSGSYLQAMLALALVLIIAPFAGCTAWLARKVSGGKVFGQGGMKSHWRGRPRPTENAWCWLKSATPGWSSAWFRDKSGHLHHLPKGK
jgi:hypothetical protein